MHNGRLKKLRVVLSLLFFVVITLLFIELFGNIFNYSQLILLRFQFVPSLVKFIATFSTASLGFVFILLLTLLFGRVYCSTLCPLGTLQDILAFLSRKLSPRKKLFRYRKPFNWLRFGLLAAVILSLFTGSILLVNFLDPYSAFGKIISNIFRPSLVAVNNVTSIALAQADIYWLPRVKWIALNKAAVALAMGWTVLLVILVAKHGRLYCNTLCPVGTLLGLFAKVSLFRIRLDKSVCNSCGKCSAVCKAECINPKDQSVDFSRCVGCMNCLSPCPDNGVKFRPFWAKDEVKMVDFDKEKRDFFKKSGLVLAGTLVAGNVFSQEEKKKEVIPASVPINREHPVTPPGAKSQERFNSLCTACHLCVSACPTQVLQPTYFLYGLSGFLQPRMDYITNFCNFECTLCGEVCPTGAILPVSGEEKKLLQLGKSYFVKENCIVYTKDTICGACSEHCPTKAVQMVPYKEKLNIPEVNNTICVGCGACEYACPTDPKSIYVDGNPVHLVAEKPKEIKVEEKIDYKEEFPF